MKLPHFYTKVQSSRLWPTFKSLASTLAFVWLFTNHIAQATVVPTESMSPTILVGDHFFLDKMAFPANYPEAVQKLLPARRIERGDILAFWSPEDRKTRLVKRVIGLPGETIEIRGNDVYINGSRLLEPYTVFGASEQREDFVSVTIPPDQFYVMGDNRDNSRDSRYFGFAHREDVIGKPLFVYWSFETPSYQTADFAHYRTVALHFFTKTRWLRTGTMLR